MLGLAQQARRRGDIRRGRSRRCDSRRRRGLDLGLNLQKIARDLQVGRAGATCPQRAEGIAQRIGNLVDAGDGAGPARQRLHDAKLVLQLVQLAP
jgi:hypothetical protein